MTEDDPRYVTDKEREWARQIVFYNVGYSKDGTRVVVDIDLEEAIASALCRVRLDRDASTKIENLDDHMREAEEAMMKHDTS